MNVEMNDLLETLAVESELSVLSESQLYGYLANALDECGVEYTSTDFEGLVEEAAEAYALHEKRGRVPPKKTKKGWKMVFGVLKQVGRIAAKTALWGGGAALKTAGWAAKGLGNAAQHVGQGMHNTNKKVAWTSKKKS
jgi:hypothetical protein